MAWKQGGCSRWRAAGTGTRRCETLCVLAALSGGKFGKEQDGGLGDPAPRGQVGEKTAEEGPGDMEKTKRWHVRRGDAERERADAPAFLTRTTVWLTSFGARCFLGVCGTSSGEVQ